MNEHISLDNRYLNFLLISSAIVLSLFQLLIILNDPLSINWDVAVFLESALRILEGQTPHVDYTFLNLPLLQYLKTIPILISRLTGLHYITTTLLIFWICTMWSTWACYQMSKKIFAPNSFYVFMLIPLSVLMYSTLAFMVDEYGQREFLCLVLFLPGLLIRFARSQGLNKLGSPLGLFSYGVVAAIGSSLKPHFLLIPFVLEFYWLLRYRNYRGLLHAEVYGYIVFGTLYLVALLLSQEMLTAIITDLSYAQSGYIKAYALVTFDMQILNPLVVLGALCAISCLIPINSPSRLQHFLYSHALFIILGIALFLLQGTGFSYHLIFVKYGLILVMFVLFYKITQIFNWKPVYLLTIVLFSISGCVLSAMAYTLPTRFERSPLQEIIVDNTAIGDEVLVLAVSTPFGYPTLMQIDRRQAATELDLGVYRIETAWLTSEERTDPNLVVSPILQNFLQIIVDDISKEPRLIIIQKQRAQFYAFLVAQGFIATYIEPFYSVLDETEERIIFKIRES